MKYSITTKSFYAPDFDYQNAPTDLIDVSQSDFEAAIEARANGSTIDFINGELVITPAPPPPPPKIKAVTMRQARLALLGAGLLPTVNAALAAMTGAQGEAARIEWEYSQEVQRDRGLVMQLGTGLGMTEAQLDALFIAAAAIP